MPTAAKPAAATKKTAARKTTAAKKPAATPKKPAAKSRESKTSKRKLVAIDRTMQAIRLRGKEHQLSFTEIGKVLGISRQAAHQLVSKYYDQAIEEAKEEAEGLRQFEIECLNDLLREAWVHIKAKDLKAVNTARQLVMDRAKLRGLITDKQEVDANVVTGFFALPMAAVTPEEWAARAQASTVGEADAAEQLLKDADAPAAS
ncbi:Sigma-70, region 4 [Burkholderia sp. YR290]|nr:Sigma-70, region 4 [Burkholderia sp. YR290]